MIPDSKLSTDNYLDKYNMQYHVIVLVYLSDNLVDVDHPGDNTDHRNGRTVRPANATIVAIIPNGGYILMPTKAHPIIINADSTKPANPKSIDPNISNVLYPCGTCLSADLEI